MKYLLIVYLCLSANLLVGQDSLKYYSITTIGREFVGYDQYPNEFYIQSLHGVKFNESFGILGGVGFIYYEFEKLLPTLISVRKSPHSAKKWGYNIDFGYLIPLRIDTDEPEFKRDYKIDKGGSYFNPELSRVVYDGNFLVSINFGYRVYRFKTTYLGGTGVNDLVEERITRRTINLGLTLEL